MLSFAGDSCNETFSVLHLFLLIAKTKYMVTIVYIANCAGLLIFRAGADPRNSGISAKSHEIPQKTRNNAKSAKKYFQIHVGKTYLMLILAIRPVLFTPNVQI